MKLDDLTRDLLARAVDLYLDRAWPGRKEEKRPELPADERGPGLLSSFTDESKRAGGRASHRYVLRLGNERYPHMKLVVEEYFLHEEYVFSVDTHDEVALDPSYPDYAAWQDLKKVNLGIKKAIEAAWQKAGIPTYASLKELVEGDRSRKKGGSPTPGRILVADDERGIADAVASILIGEGFDVLLAHDGDEAVKTAIRERPDLILMDYQMPKINGVEAAVRIRRTQVGSECRILLATASLIDLSKVSEADGFLMKPYSREILVSFIRALLRGES